jgi:hypothetical protein
MKTISNLLIFSLFLILLTSCQKEGPAGATGAQGPQGALGPIGPQGIAGNANVTQYTYDGPFDFNANLDFNLQVSTTLDTMNRSLWFVYLKYNGGFEYYYALPGFGYNGATNYRNTFYFNAGANKVIQNITRLAGSGEVYAGIKIIRVFANTVSTGGREVSLIPPIDFTNYEEVCRYYHIAR